MAYVADRMSVVIAWSRYGWRVVIESQATIESDAENSYRFCHRQVDIRHLTRNTPSFIDQKMWPPNSPDLNPVDYSIWSIMEHRVYQTRIQNTDELRQRLIAVWNELEQHLIDSAIDQWRRR